MSKKIITGRKNSSTATGLILIDSAARAMTMEEYRSLIKQTIAEEGNLDCFPMHTIFCTTHFESKYTMWIIPNYLRGE